MQSSSEELTTLKEELENRNLELAEANNDFANLLASADIPIVMLDRALRIRRFNAGAQRTLNLVPADVGRPMNDLNMSLAVENLDGIVSDVTLENKIEGAVLVLDRCWLSASTPLEDASRAGLSLFLQWTQS